VLHVVLPIYTSDISDLFALFSRLYSESVSHADGRGTFLPSIILLLLRNRTRNKDLINRVEGFVTTSPWYVYA